jgi:nitroreductase
MDLLEAIKRRHSVRQYLDKVIPADIIAELKQEIARCNQESGLNIQMVNDDSEAFSGIIAKYSRFSGVSDYLVIMGKKDDANIIAAGYYGERLVLLAQQLGLNTCWVGGTYSKKKCKVNPAPGEKIIIAISLGYGANQGVERKSKPLEQLHNVTGELPEWFMRGMEAAMLAPTAINQQKFMVSLDGETIRVTAGRGPYAKVDLGIVKYHLEVGSGKAVEIG